MAEPVRLSEERVGCVLEELWLWGGRVRGRGRGRSKGKERGVKGEQNVTHRT